MVWRTLGRTSIHVSPYKFSVSLILKDDALTGAHQYHVQVSAHHRNGLGSEFTKLRSAKIKERTEYIGDPSLIDILLRRAEKRTVGPAEYVVRDAMNAAKRKALRLEGDLQQGFDPEEFDAELETLFPASQWADVPGESSPAGSTKNRLVADGGERQSAATEQCKHCGEEIEGDVVMLHGRFPMHGDCYGEVIQS